MFNRDGIFGKKEGNVRTDSRGNVNATPGLGQAASRNQAEAPPERSPQEPAKSPPKAEEVKGSKLIVGPDIKLKGVEITDCDTLVVEGRVEASMDSRVINIAERGVFAGTVGIDLAEIHGRFEGELTARKQLVIRSTGKVSGKIRYGKITIEEGGELSGDVSTLQPSAAVNTRGSVSLQEIVMAARQLQPSAAVNTRGSAPSAVPPADIMTPYDPFARTNTRTPQAAGSA